MPTTQDARPTSSPAPQPEPQLEAAAPSVLEVPEELLTRVRAYVDAQGLQARESVLDARPGAAGAAAYPAVDNAMFEYIRHVGHGYAAAGHDLAHVLAWVAATAWLEGVREAAAAQLTDRPAPALAP